MLDKKGSHIGFMLSFSIFVVFLIFAYGAINYGLKSHENKKYVLENLKKKFIDKIESSLIIVTLFENSSGYNCISLDASNFSQYNYIARKGESVVPSYKNGDILRIEYDGNPALFKVYFSKERFNNYPTENSGCTISSIRKISKKKEIFETKIISLKNNYSIFYDKLKEDMEFPSEKDFGFSFEYENGTTIETPERKITGEIYIEEIPINYIDLNGNFSRGKIKLKVW